MCVRACVCACVRACVLVLTRTTRQPALNPLMSVEVHGKIVDSLGPGQKTEMQASSLQVHDNSFDVEVRKLISSTS